MFRADSRFCESARFSGREIDRGKVLAYKERLGREL